MPKPTPWIMRITNNMGTLTEPAVRAEPTIDNTEELYKAPLRPIQSETKHWARDPTAQPKKNSALIALRMSAVSGSMVGSVSVHDLDVLFLTYADCWD